MFDPTITSRAYPQAGAYALPPVLPREALAGVRTRRILALCIDLIIVGIIAFLLWSVLTIATFGLALFILAMGACGSAGAGPACEISSGSGTISR